MSPTVIIHINFIQHERQKDNPLNSLVMIHLDEFPMKWHESVAGPTMLHLMAFCAMLSVVGCDTTHIEQSQDLMVLQQTDSVRGGATGRHLCRL